VGRCAFGGSDGWLRGCTERGAAAAAAHEPLPPSLLRGRVRFALLVRDPVERMVRDGVECNGLYLTRTVLYCNGM